MKENNYPYKIDELHGALPRLSISVDRKIDRGQYKGNDGVSLFYTEDLNFSTEDKDFDTKIKERVNASYKIIDEAIKPLVDDLKKQNGQTSSTISPADELKKPTYAKKWGNKK